MIISDKLKTVLLKDIKSYEKNTKIHTGDQIERIKKSIEDVNYIQPIMVDKNNTIIIGHARHEALKLIDVNMEVEVIDGSSLSSKQVQELRIKDNALNQSEWDFGNLGDELNKIYTDFTQKKDEIFKDFGFDDNFLNSFVKGEEYNKIPMIEKNEEYFLSSQTSKHAQNNMLIKIGHIEFYINQKHQPKECDILFSKTIDFNDINIIKLVIKGVVNIANEIQSVYKT